MQLFAVLFALATASGVYATDQKVIVGDSNKLVFNPPSLTNVQVGDNIIFEFQSKNHSVTQSSFTTPCSPLANGINSGFQLAPSSAPFPTWNITIQNTSAPFWFYCAQTIPVVHCQMGMVFAINPTAEKSFQAFQATATASATSSNSTSDPSSSSSSSASSGGAPASNPSPATSNPSPAAPNPPSAPSSGAPISQSANGTSAGAAPTTTNGVAHMGTSISGILALAGLVAGLML
ncbi:hypothetical protein H2248_009176 [Termitomyces sp. 'cryptogamus']|nr:hypothetical protein H2248_009176 [Termitomyces sp. 'cryptogamus']